MSLIITPIADREESVEIKAGASKVSHSAFSFWLPDVDRRQAAELS